MGRSGQNRQQGRAQQTIPVRDRVAANDARWRPEQIEEARRYYLSQGYREIICSNCNERHWLRSEEGLLCTECLRASGWSIGSETPDPALKGKPRLVTAEARQHLPVEHRDRITALQDFFTPGARKGTTFETFKGLGELMEYAQLMRGHLEGDDRFALAIHGVPMPELEPDFRYLVVPVGPANEDGYATIVLAPNTSSRASTLDLVVDVAPGAPVKRVRCSRCSLPIVGGEDGKTCRYCLHELAVVGADVFGEDEELAHDWIDRPEVVNEGSFQHGTYSEYKRFQAPKPTQAGVFTLVGWSSQRKMIVWMHVSASSASEAVRFAGEWRDERNKVAASEWRTSPGA